jgi:decaprenylphospho-beta-D-erythro-pentofuranosid-2-ulose 2-reductase
MGRRASRPGREAALPRRVLVLGGTSEIAAAIVRELELPACEVALAGRDREGLEQAARRLGEAGCGGVRSILLDACEPSGHRAALAQASALLGGIDLVILAVGVLGERGGLPEDVGAAVEVLRVNVVGAGSLLLESARVLRAQGHGTIVVLSSVAAERARASNAVYCASKAGLDALGQGLADALAPTGVRVLVVRPGFVTTRMTRGLPVPPLATNPQTVARATVRGLRRGAQTVWAPPRLRWAMACVRLLPRPLFRRLPL